MLEPFNSPYVNPNLSQDISSKLLEIFKRRRTIRHFSSETPPEEILLHAIQIAGLAPNGANKQPWSFALIQSPEIKKKIQEMAEEREQVFYNEMTHIKWHEDLKPLHTEEKKPFLTEAPYLIPIFYQPYSLSETGEKQNHYYVKESVGIATGLLISALHLCGLSLLTYTPTKMQFLTELLGRPKEERVFMLLAVGYARKEALVPRISKKTMEQILTLFK